MSGRPPAPPGNHPASDSAARDTGLKPYAKVITKKAITHRGLVITHQIEDKLYFEVPRPVLGADLLLVASVARASAGQDKQYGGDWLGQHVIRFERLGRRVLLRDIQYEVVADTTLPVYRAVEQSAYAPVIASFPIETFGPDSAPVIEVTRLYTTAVSEFAMFKDGFDEKRAFIERVVAFPENVEVEATQTQNAKEGAPGATDSHPTQSVLAHWSMVRLPATPMIPRRADPRIGYFLTEQIDYGTEEQRAAKRDYINRWRLVKKDPSAAVSDPVAPLVYYVDPATPAQWVPWIKKGIEDWLPAFEAAGFSHAIVAREAPRGDTTWSPEDVRHTVIRWLPSTVENAYGPQMVDPRSGEVLNGSVRVFHNVLNLARDWYIVQVGALDPRARAIIFPDSLMGRLLEFVIAHEVGHTLGLRHNHEASSEYPADSVRSRTWVHRMGFCASIMDYCRFDYVAQPEDSIPLNDLVPRVGPYDVFAIHWGYTPIDVDPASPPRGDETDPVPPTRERATDAERPVLDRWLLAQDSVPWLRYEGDEAARGPDPGVETEAVGDADAVKSSTAGLKNIERTARLLMPLALRPGEQNDDLQELFDALVSQWRLEVGHVVKIVGGVYGRQKSGSQPGPRFTPAPADRQRAAVQFLAANVFQTPQYFLDSALLMRIEPAGAVARIRQVQSDALKRLLSEDRIDRLTERRALVGPTGDAYDAAELFADVRAAIWSELSRPKIQIDAFRRNLQREHLMVLDTFLNPPVQSSSCGPAERTCPGGGPVDRAGAPRSGETDTRMLARGELEAIHDAARKAVARASDQLTRLHLEQVIVETDRSLRAPVSE